MSLVGGPLDGLRTRVENPRAYCIAWCHLTNRGCYQAYYLPRAGVLRFEKCELAEDGMGTGR